MENTTQTEPVIDPSIQPMTKGELETYKLHRRFDRMGRLVGDEAMKKLMSSHVMVLGLGGVGSWAAESLVRSGIGEITLVDFDEVCITNFNRQLHALQGKVGQQKVDVMAERLRMINPSVKINPFVKFYNERHQAEIFARRPDFVVDAIDSITSKCHLIAHCRSNGIPIISSMGSGGRLDATQVRIEDLARTTKDPLARSVRLILREKYGFPDQQSKTKFDDFGVMAIYSLENPTMPKELTYDNGKGFRCVCTNNENEFFNCDNRNMIYGNAGFVTGAFGFAAASHVVRELISESSTKTLQQ